MAVSFIPAINCEADLSQRIVKAMGTLDAYPIIVASVEHHETHISHVFLAGEFAYKIKKPIKTDFLDYSTLELRRFYCEEEYRLDRRYAKNLYIGVVPITIENGKISVEGGGEPIDYAVKMHRFPDDALLSHRIDAGLLTSSDVRELAMTIASFHASAQHCEKELAQRVPLLLFANLKETIETIEKDTHGAIASSLGALRRWTDRFCDEHLTDFAARSEHGFIRECHGDLHLQNIVHWNGKLVPFDGIEFSDDFRWVDVMNDAAFLAMDLAARGHLDLSRSFINSYLESTGDYASLVVLRLYLVYRALIRAMVAKMKADQHQDDAELYRAAINDFRDHVDLAYRFTLTDTPALYITHGLSGSGKTTVSEIVVARRGAIRLRSDVERKRHFGLTDSDSIDDTLRKKIYSESANIATYNRLVRLASGILRDGYPVVIDATFLKQADRTRFRRFAEREGVPFAILDCHADVQTLRQRIADRIAKGNDASDADFAVLDLQLKSQEGLTSQEQESVVNIPDLVATIDHL